MLMGTRMHPPIMRAFPVSLAANATTLVAACSSVTWTNVGLGGGPAKSSPGPLVTPHYGLSGPHDTPLYCISMREAVSSWIIVNNVWICCQPYCRVDGWHSCSDDRGVGRSAALVTCGIIRIGCHEST